MTFPTTELKAAEFPALLREIPQPPHSLNYRGLLPPFELPLLTIIGSRQYSTYGKQVVNYLIDGLNGYRVGIVSGLALGIDSLAHEAALRNHLYTLAIPGSGLNDTVLYPARHRPLARRILEAGGGLLSEFAPAFKATKWSFIERNRLMAGIATATLVIEASEKSGTLATARMCVDYNRDLLVVPGSIFSENSKGPHLFMKLGATPITTPNDIINALNLEQIIKKEPSLFSNLNLSSDEQSIISALTTPADIDLIIRSTKLPTQAVSIILMQLELRNIIACDHGIYRRLV